MSTWIVPRRQDLFAALENDFNRFYEQFYGTKKQLQSPGTFPKMDVYRDQTHLVIQMAVAGYGEEDIDVRLEKQESGSILTVEGMAPISETSVDYLVKELRTSAFQRALRLPEYVLPDTCAADIKDGLLTISFAMKSEQKEPEEKVRQISIRKN